MCIPFQLPLPNDLPPSMNLGVGRIYYNVNAEIKRERNVWKFQGPKKSIGCNCLITQHSPMPMPAPIRWTEWDDQNAQKRGLGYDVSMDYDTFGPGNPIVVKFSVKLLNPDLKIKEIFIGLKEYRVFMVLKNKNFSKRYMKEGMISGNQFLKMLDANNTWSSDFKIDISNNEVNWTTERYNINVHHKVKVKIRFELSEPKNINLERLVNIKNILDVSDYNHIE